MTKKSAMRRANIHAAKGFVKPIVSVQSRDMIVDSVQASIPALSQMLPGIDEMAPHVVAILRVAKTVSISADGKTLVRLDLK